MSPAFSTLRRKKHRHDRAAQAGAPARVPVHEGGGAAYRVSVDFLRRRIATASWRQSAAAAESSESDVPICNA